MGMGYGQAYSLFSNQTPHFLSATCMIYKSTLGHLAWELSFA